MNRNYLFILGVIILVSVVITRNQQTGTKNSLSTEQAATSPYPTKTLEQRNNEIMQILNLPNYNVLKTVNSPDGNYFAIEGVVPDIRLITIKDKTGRIIIPDVATLNYDAIRTGTKKLGLTGLGQAGYQVKEWKSNTSFVMIIHVANGMIFEVLVNVPTGKVDESTFTRIK